MMTVKTFTLRLTREELWYLMNSYEASFTDPDSKNKAELSVSRKVTKAWTRSRKYKPEE